MQILVIVIGILLIGFNIKAIKNEKNSFSQSLNKAERGMSNYDIELGKLRKEFAETILELQGDIEILKDQVEYLKIMKENTAEDDDKPEDDFVEEKKQGELSNSVKIDEIGKLLKDGLTIEEIAEKLGIGKGEVLLIEQLFIK